MRIRTSIIAAVLSSLLAANQAAAEQWVDKMLAEREHNFGTIARGEFGSTDAPFVIS